MTTPVRLRLSHQRGFDLQAHSREVNGLPAVNVARPGRWGNPYKAGDKFKVFHPPREKSPRTGNVVNLRPAMTQCTWRTRREPMTAQEAVDKFRERECGIYGGQRFLRLRGLNLACWCKLCPDHAATGRALGSNCTACAPCHADVLLEISNRPICEAVA